jgi:hypothetical protein
MAIYRLLQNVPMEPEDLHRLTEAYEQTLTTLSLTDRNDPVTEMIARKIIELGQIGLKDPAVIATRAIEELGVRPPK